MAPKKLKKKGGKKLTKKKSPSPTETGGGGGVPPDQPEPVPAAQASGSGKSKKKSRKGKTKLTKSERALARLEKACAAFEQQAGVYREFLVSADRWLRRNGPLLAEVLRKIDEADSGVVSHADLKLALRNFGAPCDSVRLHVLAKLLDPALTGSVDYRALGAGLRVPGVPRRHDGEDRDWRERADSEEENDEARQAGRPRLTVTKETIDRCPHCKMGVWKPRQVEDDSFVELELRLVPFDGAACHPGHVTVPASGGTTLHGLVRSLRALAHTPSTCVRVYRPAPDPVPDGDQPEAVAAAADAQEDELMPLDDAPGATLRELGIRGGSLDRPASVRLRYDYALQGRKCPLLDCDYYFAGEGPRSGPSVWGK